MHESKFTRSTDPTDSSIPINDSTADKGTGPRDENGLTVVEWLRTTLAMEEDL